MNLEFLKNVIIPQRQLEIKEGKNMATRQPIYVVLDLEYMFCGGHDDEGWFSGSILNNKGKSSEYGYLDLSLDSEYREFKTSDDGMKLPSEVIKIYYDRVTAFFLTRKGAKEYLAYQSHNLSSEAYIYTFYSGYANKEMDKLLNGQ